MDLLTIRTEIRERLGETTEEDFWKDAQILRAVNEGLRRFSQEEKWPWLYTTYSGPTISSGNDTIELIDDVSIARHFSLILTKQGDTTGKIYVPRRITPGDGVRVRAEFAGSKQAPRFYYITHAIKNTYVTGDPEGIAMIAKVLPEPDAIYNVEYSFIRNPKMLAADTDQADIPDTYVEAVIAYATGSLWLKELNGGGKAQEQFNIYNIVVDQARKELTALTVGETLVWGRKAPEWRPEDRFPLVNLPQNVGI